VKNAKRKENELTASIAGKNLFRRARIKDIVVLSIDLITSWTSVIMRRRNWRNKWKHSKRASANLRRNSRQCQRQRKRNQEHWLLRRASTSWIWTASFPLPAAGSRLKSSREDRAASEGDQLPSGLATHSSSPFSLLAFS
jgi:hypothetical protein